MRRWFLLATLPSAVSGCANHTPEQPKFPAAYQLVSERGRVLEASEVLVYLYDDALKITAIARRDNTSVGIGGYGQIRACAAGDYCIRIEEAPGPLVVFADPLTSLELDGWRYGVERSVLAHEGCDRFTARHPGREVWFTYLNCGPLGITSMTTLDGETIVKALQLRSYVGLGFSSSFP
ncbi:MULTISPECIES: hypothetical protein [unclassified Brevundimonas]|uniref:hypothetical protein n=1 Tax=unclassified Brevundimonas TaxID=2622653 RepID=UPI003F909AD7